MALLLYGGTAGLYLAATLFALLMYWCAPAAADVGLGRACMAGQQQPAVVTAAMRRPLRPLLCTSTQPLDCRPLDRSPSPRSPAVVGLLTLHTMPTRETFTVVRTLQVGPPYRGWPAQAQLGAAGR